MISKAGFPLFTYILVMMFHPAFAQYKGNLKVITYNIMNGYGGVMGYNGHRDTTREHAAARFIASEHPDVVAMDELVGFNQERLLSFAKSYGHHYAVILKKDGYPVGLTSDRPITVITKMMRDGFGHGMIHAVTYGINFFAIHLNPGDYRMRLKESELIRTYMHEVLTKKDTLYMVLGDFNSHSPFDAFLDKKRPMLLDLRQHQDSSKSRLSTNLIYNHYAYSVISSFLGYPLIDVCERKMKAKDRFSFPTPILIGTYRKNKAEVIATRERIDYILASPQLAEMCTGATIINSGVVEKLSDHFPVMATFNIK